MKNRIIYLGLILLLFSQSCRQQEDLMFGSENTESKNVSVSKTTSDGIILDSRGFLIFKSVEEYENQLHLLSEISDSQLNEWEGSLGFTSSYTHYNIDFWEEQDEPMTPIQGFDNSTYGDPLLLRLLDKDGIVQIGDYVFAVFLDKGYVLETRATNLSFEYDNLKEGIFNHETMNKFSGNWDEGLAVEYETVFDFLKTGTIGFQSSGGFDLHLMSHKDVIIHDLGYMSPDPTLENLYNFKHKTVYQHTAFYSSLMTEFKYQRKSFTGIWYAQATQIELVPGLLTNSSTYCEFTKKNSSQTENPTIPADKTNMASYTDNKLTWRPYEGTRGLNNYKFRSRYRYKDLGANQIAIVQPTYIEKL